MGGVVGEQRVSGRVRFTGDSERFLYDLFGRALNGDPGAMDRLRGLMAPGTHRIGDSPRERFLFWLAEYVTGEGSAVRMDGQHGYELSEANRRTILSRARSMLGMGLLSVPVRVERAEAPQRADIQERYTRLQQTATSGNFPAAMRERSAMAQEGYFLY